MIIKRNLLIIGTIVWGIEAMSVGRPVIASDVGGISEWLVDGETGYLVSPQDSSAIADRVIRLLSDQKLLREMSQKARNRSLDFDIELHAKSIIRLYEKVIADHATARAARR